MHSHMVLSFHGAICVGFSYSDPRPICSVSYTHLHSTTKQKQLLLIKTVPDHLKTVFLVIRLSVTIYNKTTINFDYFKNV